MRTISGIMLVTYVTGMIVVLELGAKSLVDADTVRAVQSTLDLPTFMAMVVFVGISIRLELYKPKYKLPAKKRPVYDSLLLVVGIIITASMIFLKYG